MSLSPDDFVSEVRRRWHRRPENRAEWERLAAALDLAEGFQFFVIEVADPTAELFLAKLLAENARSRGLQLIGIDLSEVPTAESPVGAVLRTLKASERPALFYVYAGTKRHGDTEWLQDFFLYFNQKRDVAADHASASLMLALHPEDWAVFRRSAPDFWSIRQSLFHFTGAATVEILRKDVEGWNRWRKADDGIQPDLSGADLSGADLSGADLRAAKLTDVNLSGANLTDAKLNGAHFRAADLSGTDLSGTDLSGADLSGARFDRAKFNGTIFANVDLRGAIDLDCAEHYGPSHISTSVLERSHGQIPATFLSGCGLADWEVMNTKLWNPDLTGDDLTVLLYELSRIREEQPINAFRVFISYTRKDEPFVEALERRFDAKGIRYWRDVHDMKAGRLTHQIDRAIELNPLVLLVLSEHSVHGDWVEWEASKARELEKMYRRGGNPRDLLVPVALDDAWKFCDWPRVLRHQIEDYNILDFSSWEDDDELERHFGKLYEGLVLNYRS